MNYKLLMPMLVLALCAMAPVWPARTESASHEFSEEKIRPVLSKQCYECHRFTHMMEPFR